jgi:hypothetical protein
MVADFYEQHTDDEDKNIKTHFILIPYFSYYILIKKTPSASGN